MLAMVLEARPEEDMITLGLVEALDADEGEGLINALGFVDTIDNSKTEG